MLGIGNDEIKDKPDITDIINCDICLYILNMEHVAGNDQRDASFARQIPWGSF